MRSSLVSFALLLIASPALAQSWRLEPVRSALAAVEGDSAARMERRWTDALRAGPPNPAALLGLATLTRLQYRHQLSDSLFARVLSVADAGDTLRMLATLGRAEGLYNRGDFSRATGAYRTALALATELGELGFLTEARIGLAQTLIWNEGKAEGDSIISLTAPDLPALPPALAAFVRCNRSGDPVDPGELDELEEARAGLRAAERASEQRLIAFCTLQVAAAHFRFGTMDSALMLSASAASLQDRIHDRLGFARSLGWRGYLLMTNGQYGSAREELDRAIREGSAVGNLAAVSQAHMNLTAVYLRFGDIATATGFAELAESELRQVGNQRALGTMRVLRGDLARAAGDTAWARAAYNDAIEWGARYGGYPVVAPYRSLARMARARGDLPEAERLLVRAESLANRHGLEVWARRIQYDFGVLALARNDLTKAERAFTTLLSRLRPEEQERSYAATVRLAEVALLRRDIDRTTTLMLEAADSLDARRQRLGDRSLRLLLFQRRDDDADPDLAIATILAGMVRGGRIEAAFSLAERRRARELRERMLRLDIIRGAPRMGTSGHAGTLSSAELIDAIPDSSTAIIEYVTGRGAEPSVAFVLSKRGLRAAILPTADTMLADSRRYQVYLQRLATVPALARRLGRAIMDPVLEQLGPEIRNLLIVPDGPLHFVPFDALETGEGPVITRYAVSLLPSATVGAWLWQRPVSTGPAEILAFGDPTFGSDEPAGSEASAFRAAFIQAGGLDRLAGSGAEVGKIGRYATRSTVLRRDRASEAYLRANRLDHFRVIHFATHALVDDRSAARTALALAPGAGEDGFVSAADLAGLDLRADLVVLSACRTAQGQVIDGEGIQGLTAPLIEAGARTIVATRWPISDARTVEFVEAMYRGLAQGMTVGAALQSAKLEARRRGLPPGQWAAFVLIGDPSVRIPLHQPRGMTTMWWIAGGIFVLAAYGAWTVKRWRGERRSPASESSARTHQS